jgi:hypothetical protein
MATYIVLIRPLFKHLVSPVIRERIRDEGWKSLIKALLRSPYRSKRRQFFDGVDQRRDIKILLQECLIILEYRIALSIIPQKLSDFHVP